ncbi:MAG: MFS transporter [Verrucomicrobiae bacterium]|nr:MFS transporter [Verrucomicrobiae bacterium]
MNDSPPASSNARRAALLVAFMWVAYFLNYCDRQAVFSMTGSLKADLRMTDTQLGLVGAVFLWVYAFGCPLAGQIGDRFSKRLLVVLSLVIWSLVTVATGFAGTAVMMLGLRAAMGISESLFMPTAIALTANAHAPDRRSRAIAALTTAQIAGTVAGSWFGGWMADRGEWRTAFFILGAVGVLYALPYFLFLRSVDENPDGKKEESGGRFPVAALARVPTFLVLCLVFPVFVFGLWLLYGWLPTFLREKFDLNQADAAFNATVYLQATTAAGLLGGGILADALYRRTKASRLWLMTASLLLCAPCLHYLGNCETLSGTRIAASGFGLFSGLLMGNIFPAAFEVVPSDTRASAVGLLNFFGAIMSGFATLFGGLWKASLGIDRLLTITALAYLAGGLVIVATIRLLFARDHARVASPS